MPKGNVFKLVTATKQQISLPINLKGKRQLPTGKKNSIFANNAG